MTDYYLPKILLIEDDCDDVEFFKDALEKVSPKTALIIANSCDAGLKSLITEIPLLPSAIFIDLRMPVVDGFECIPIIKSNDRLKEIPIVILSSSVNPKDIELLYDLGVSYFITKPPTFEKLQEVLKKVVNTPHIFKSRTRETFHIREFD